MAIAAAVLLVAGAVAVGGAAAQQDGEFEPNDDLANATAIEPGTYANLTITEGDLDVYAVELAAGDALTASIGFSNAAGDLDFALLSPDGDLLGASVSTNDTESLSYVAGEAGAHYLVVYGYENATGAYDLTVDRTAGNATDGGDALEPNDDTGNATALEPGTYTDLTVAEDDLDFYAVELAAGDALSASIAFSNATGDLDFALLSPNGTLLAVSDSVTDAERLSTVADETGRYYLVVYGFEGATGPYELTLAVASGGGGDGGSNASVTAARGR